MRLIAFAMLLFAGTMAAQNARLPQEAASARDFAPDGWHVYFTNKGDLNKDGLADIAFVLENNDSGKRVLAIAFGKKGGYRLQGQDGGRFITPDGNTDAFVDMNINADGVLTVKFLLPGTPGYNYDDRFGFRYQNKRFELVGWERRARSTENDRVHEFTSVSYTFKKIVYEDRRMKSEMRQKHFNCGRLKSLGEIVPGRFEVNYDDV